MALTDVPPGASVFVDANIFIYHFAGHSRECSALLARVEGAELNGFTGQGTLGEVAHRLMILEAIERGLRAGRNVAARLAARPELVRQLSRYYFSTLRIPRMGFQVIPLRGSFLEESQEYRQVHGLLWNDSLVPLYMRAAGLSMLASADAAFDRLAGIRRFSPADL